MNEFDVTLSLYQKRIMDSNKSVTLEPDRIHSLDDQSKQHQKIDATEIEDGQKQIGNLNFDRIALFNIISIVLPMNILSCKIEKQNFLFFSGSNREVCISAKLFDTTDEIEIHDVKKQYNSGMQKSKQKTIWLEQGKLNTLKDAEISYMVAQHPMPQKNILNLTFMTKTTRGIIAVIGTISSTAEAFWIHTFKSIMATLRYVEEEFVDGIIADERSN